MFELNCFYRLKTNFLLGCNFVYFFFDGPLLYSEENIFFFENDGQRGQEENEGQEGHKLQEGQNGQEEHEGHVDMKTLQNMKNMKNLKTCRT